MLSVLFTILMIGIFGKLIGFAFHAAWGLTKVVCTLVVLPVVLIVLVVAGKGVFEVGGICGACIAGAGDCGDCGTGDGSVFQEIE